MGVRAACALGTVLLASGCFFTAAHVELDHHPTTPRRLEAAGVRSLAYRVVVTDGRDVGDPRDVGRRQSNFGVRPHVYSTRDVKLVVKEAIEREMRAHDLRVAEDADVEVRVDLTWFFASVRDSPGGVGSSTGGVEIVAVVEGECTVWDTASGERVLRTPLDANGSYETLPYLLTEERYEVALEIALARFARRVVRHPDMLIAYQKIAAARPSR